MTLNWVKEAALLTWITEVCPEESVGKIAHLEDGRVLLKFSYKLQGKEPSEALMTSPLVNKVDFILSALNNDFHFSRSQASLILEKISQRINLELQLAKVVLLLCYCSFKKDKLVPDMGLKSELLVASMFRFVKDDSNGLSLNEGTEKFLTKDSVMNVSTSSSEGSGSSSFYTDDESPIFGRFHRLPRVQFQELCMVASSSDGSPVQATMSTPQFQLKRLRKELAHEGDVRDELEKELANQIRIISEKEGVISQLQHRVDRVLREQAELDMDHKAALLELQEKNESLLHRVHEVLKQCQDLKTDNSQKERKIDELTEENGTLAAQVRNTFAQLARAEEEVANLTLAHNSSQAEWKNKREFLEQELNKAVTHQESLSEQVQILQGKISVLEDELQKAQSQEKGEVLGPIMEWEKLKEELADLTLRLAQLQDTIARLKKEKAEVEGLLAEERTTFENETRRLETVVFNLEQSISTIRMERAALQETLQAQKETLTAQIAALESDVSRLQQVEVQLTEEIKISTDLRQQRSELEGKVASLDKMVNFLHAEIQSLETERASQQGALDTLRANLESAQATLQEFEKKLENHQRVVDANASLEKEVSVLQQEVDKHLQAIWGLQGEVSSLRQEKTEEENKVYQAVTKIESIQIEILELSKQISLKDEEIGNLRKEYDSLDHELKLVKDQNVEINEMIELNRKEHEDTIKRLQQELLSASSKATEKQKETMILSAEVTSLKNQIFNYHENELQKEQKLSVLEAEHNGLKDNLTLLQNQLVEATAMTSQKESELILLQQELHQQESLREKVQELETVRREELEKKLDELQAKILELSTLACEREACVSSLQDEMNDQQLRAKQSENDLRSEFEKKVGILQGHLETSSRDAADKNYMLELLDQKLKQMELQCQQKEKDVLQTHQAKEDLEKRIAELNVERYQLEEYKQDLEILKKEKDHLSAEMASLKEQISRYQENEVRKQQEMSALEAEHCTLKKNLAAIKNQLKEVTAVIAQKESDLLLLQQELCQQETLREKAQELETKRHEEFERKASELEAKILEISSLASEREACVNALRDEMKEQQLRAKQSEGDLRRELEEKVETLQGQLEAAGRSAADKDHLVESLDQKLKLMELQCQEKEKDALETHQAKEDLEKKIADLHVEKQQLDECRQNLEILRKERDHLSEEVMSFKGKIGCYHENEVQKQQEMSVVVEECHMLRENLVSLQNQLLEMTTSAKQKESELLLLQQELCQQENLREKAQELETARCEEFEKKVSELNAKIQEISTLASEREACVTSLQNEMKEQQLRAKQSEDDLRRDMEEKVGTLQEQLKAASDDVANKDHLLESLEQKLRHMEVLCQQNKKDALEMHQAKEDLEKRIAELHVEKHQLHEYQKNLEVLRMEKDHLSEEVTCLKNKINCCHENEVQKQQEISVLEGDYNTLKENLAAIKNQLLEVSTSALQKESELLLLQQELRQQENLREKAQEFETTRREELERKINELQTKSQEISTLAFEREACVTSLQTELKEQQLMAKQSEDDLCREMDKKIGTLQGQLEAAKHGTADKDHLLDSLKQKLKQMELRCQQKEKDTLETHQAKENLEKRIAELHVETQQLDECQQTLEILKQERDHLSSLNQSLQRECDASLKLRAGLELKVEQQSSSLLALKNASHTLKEQNQELLEQLKIKSEAVEHYKAQVEKAKNHYNGKKQLLVESEERNQTLEHSLEASKREVKALEAELTLARMEVDQATSKEKNLASRMKSLEAQVEYADRQLRRQKKTDDIEDVRHRENLYVRDPVTQQHTTNDSLEFDLNDSLNDNGHSAIPGESSTPLVRSSERLAAKRRGFGAESLETLYFTPMSQQGNKRKGDHRSDTERKLESSITSLGDLVVDSAKKLSASARRRRTTQVINITMAKKASESGEGEESFSSLHTARSQPNLATHRSRPFSVDLSEENAAATLFKADKLQSLPGYRRSAVHTVGPPRATSTFCIGAENEPEHAADDWMRIAELQARNKVCLPHLKSSYPLESRPSLGLPSFTITDDDLRMGDPDETIRRASMIPGQIQESLNSRRFSLAPGSSSAQIHTRSQPQRSTMLPGQIRSSTAAHRTSQLTKTASTVRTSENVRSPLAPKRPGSQLQAPDTPEAKKLASCFPRPMTPKDRHNSQNRPPITPADRRQSLMFTVENTPKTSTRGDSRLQRGLNKLRNSARKSPAVASRALRSAVSAANGRSPLDSALRKSPRNKSPKSSNTKKMKFRLR